MAKQKKPLLLRGTCFVIMPFSDWFLTYYQEIFKPAVEKAGLNPIKSDDIYRPSQIMQDIWNLTKQAKILLADLTGKNPNVLYELGLAHAISKPVVLVTESIEDVPFDLRSLRVIEYDKNRPNWGQLLKTNITQAIEEALISPSESILQTFISPRPNKGKRESLPLKKRVLALQGTVDLLRRQNLEIAQSRPIGPQEADGLIRSYLRRGIPRSLIVTRLERMGVPSGWVKNAISRAIIGKE